MMAPRTLRRRMEQVRAKIDVLHNGQLHKAGHIFKVPDDMDLETAKRLVGKEILTDSIEVLDEPDEAEVELLAVIDAEPDAALDAAADNEPDDGSGEGSEEESDSEGEAPEETTDAGGEEEAVAIEDMTPEQIKEELDSRKIVYNPRTGEKKLRIKLAEALKAEAEVENDDTGEPSDSDGGGEE